MTTYTERWTEQGEMCPGGDVGGDLQASESFNRRFVYKPQPDVAEFHVLDFTAYWAIDNVNGDADDPSEPRGITVQVGYYVCTDPEDSGGTETWADYRYWEHQEDEVTTTPQQRCEKLTQEDLSEATNQMGV